MSSEYRVAGLGGAALILFGMVVIALGIGIIPIPGLDLVDPIVFLAGTVMIILGLFDIIRKGRLS